MADPRTPAVAQTRVLRLARIRRERSLPARGDVVVAANTRVGALDIVARSNTVGHLLPVPVGRYLRVPENALEKYMTKETGEEVQARDVIASKSEALGMFRRVYRAPAAGRIVARQGPWVTLDLIDAPFELKALYRGAVISVTPHQGVIIEATGALVQGVWSGGGEGYGLIRKTVDTPDAILTEDKVDVASRGVIMMAGGVTEEAIRRAVQERAAGLIVGGLQPHLRELVQTLGLPTLVTDGLGERAIAAPIFELLASHDGDETSINPMSGARNQGRPEVFIPVILTGSAGASALPPPALVAELHAPVRIAGGAHSGEIGAIAEMPAAPRVLESGASAWGAEIELTAGGRVFVPWENLELIG